MNDDEPDDGIDEEADMVMECPFCAGSGFNVIIDDDDDHMRLKMDCPECGGTGWYQGDRKMKMSKAQFQQICEMCDVPHFNHGKKATNPEFGQFAKYKSKRKKPTKKNQGRDVLFDKLCEAHGLPLPVHEFKFHPKRKWQLDYVFEGWLAVEKEGGAFVKGRHVNGAGFRNDIEKYNTAVLMGYALLRFLPEQFADGSAFATIKIALNSRGEQP